MNVPDHLSDVAYSRIMEQWKAAFDNLNVPKLIILETGITISPLYMGIDWGSGKDITVKQDV